MGKPVRKEFAGRPRGTFKQMAENGASICIPQSLSVFGVRKHIEAVNVRRSSAVEP